MKRVAITGVGIIDPLGNNKNECFANLINDFDPIQTIDKFDAYPNIQVKISAPVDYSKLTYKDTYVDRSDGYIRMAMHAVEQALADAGHPESTSKNAAVVFSSLGTSGDTRVDFSLALEAHKKRFSPRGLMENLADYVAGYIARVNELTGTATCMNAACATSLVGIDYAIKLLDTHDYAIVGGSDTMIDTTHLFSFQSLQALSCTGSRPFDVNRDGFVMGEGAGCLILETEERALARGAHIYGFISGVGISNDYYSQTSPDPNGSGSERAMTQAWNQAGQPDIDFVNAHATSTPAGDEIEYLAIRRLFPESAIYSSKGKIGHTMGGCGVIEIIHSLGSFEHGIIPRTFNLSNSIAPNDKNLLTENLNKASTVFMKNSFGFGGRCASVVVSKH